MIIVFDTKVSSDLINREDFTLLEKIERVWFKLIIIFQFF